MRPWADKPHRGGRIARVRSERTQALDAGRRQGIDAAAMAVDSPRGSQSDAMTCIAAQTLISMVMRALPHRMCASRLFIASLRRQIGTAIVAIMQTPMVRAMRSAPTSFESHALTVRASTP
ncbi:hypothetical protein [Lysobacter gummosus]|uniref:Uncharacterized protein n=1 Tax=Lysobacter gummosus TaxID=262324 RepID=A0ABY3XJ28_9GAMM|nr:hypothetical protein [Lysobacter gummosus]UNP31636.1 hypothetical protein MOV92_10470 [Lysobacter gummosus]